MNLLLIGSVIILLMVATFLLVVFLPRPLCFYVPAEVRPDLTLTPSEIESIGKEVAALIQSEYTNQLKGRNFWTHELYRDYIFTPPYHVSRLKQTFDFIEKMPGVVWVAIEKIPIEGKATLRYYPYEAYIESPANSSKLIRLTIPVLLSTALKSGVWIDGQTKLFKPDEYVLSDYSKETILFNKDYYKPVFVLTVLMYEQQQTRVVA